MASDVYMWYSDLESRQSSYIPAVLRSDPTYTSAVQSGLDALECIDIIRAAVRISI